jgi:hypothetical protein
MSLMKPKLPVGGLALGPNDLDSPPGNFQVAENVVHRREGILEPMPGDEALYVEGGWTGTTPLARTFSDWPMSYSLRVAKTDGFNYGFLSYGSTPDEWPIAEFRPGEVQCVYADGRHILSGAQFNVVLENVDDNEHEDPRRAGLPQLVGFSFASFSASGGSVPPAIPPSKTVGYTAVVRRRIVGDRFIVSAPCSKINTTLFVGVGGVWTWNVFFETTYDGVSATYEEGDEVLLYRTKSFDSVAEINDTYFLARVQKITATDIVNKYIVIEDRTMEDNLGAELYSNPGAEGSLKTNIIPPASCGTETFGLTTFFINKRTQPNVTATATGTFGELPTGVDSTTRQVRANGIGTREFVGNVSNGSNQITGVSADDRLGLAVGQILYHPDSLPDGTQITAINGAGPYTIDMSNNAFFTEASADILSWDAAQINATRGGVTLNSEWFPIGSLGLAQTRLRDLTDGSAVPLYGFVLNSTGLSDPNSGASYADKVQLNFRTVSPDQWDSFELTLTNPANWIEYDAVVGNDYITLDSVQDTRRNIVWYGKPNQPEHVSPIQFITIGNGTVYRLLNVQSCMLAFASDGIYKIEGQGDTWFITMVDNAARLVHPDCAVANTTVAFAWLESGLALCTETGTQSISKDAIGPDLSAFVKTLYGASNGPHYIWGPTMAIDRLNNEAYLNIMHLPVGDDPTPIYYACYVFNTLTAKFTTCGEEYTSMCYAPSELCVLKGRYDGRLYVDSSIATDYKIATVVYLPLVDDAGIVKQWNDVNYFFDNVPEGASDTYDVEALFGGELTSTTNVFEKDQTGAPTNMVALHCLVPRRAARGVELILGFRTSTEVSETHPSGGYYFQFKGVSVRARVSSQVIKR